MASNGSWIDEGAYTTGRPAGRQTPNALRDILKKTLQGGEKSAFRIPVDKLTVKLKGLRTQVATIAKALGTRSHVVQDESYVYMWLERVKGAGQKPSAVAKPKLQKAS